MIVVHYWGDEGLSLKHELRQTRLKIRTMPSIMREIEKEVVTASSSHAVYKDKVAQVSDQLEATAKPRNLKQVKNLRERAKQKWQIIKDSIINIHGIATEDPSFVHLIQTWPDLLVVFGLQDLIDHTNKLLSINDRNTYFTYDTTFTLGDFYLSVLLVRNVIFRSMPAFPVLFLLHKKKLKSYHSLFFQQFSSLFPSHENVPIVVDDEVAINKAVQESTQLY